MMYVCIRPLDLRAQLYKNAIHIIEYPLGNVHEAASDFFSRKYCGYNLQCSNTDDNPLISTGSASHYLNDGSEMQPDKSFKVPHRGCPNIVVEIGMSQSLESLHDKAVRYLTTTDNIMIVITIKIYSAHNNDCRMICCMYLRQQNQNNDTPVRAISFGTAAVSLPDLMDTTGVAIENVRGLFEPHGDFQGDPICNQAGMEAYQLRLPRQLLLAEDNVGININANNINYPDWIIDLFALQTTILRMLND